MLLLEIELDQIRPLEAIGKPLVAAFLSHLEVSWRLKVSVRLLYCFLAVVQLKIGFLQVEYFYFEVEFIDSR